MTPVVPTSDFPEPGKGPLHTRWSWARPRRWPPPRSWWFSVTGSVQHWRFDLHRLVVHVSICCLGRRYDRWTLQTLQPDAAAIGMIREAHEALNWICWNAKPTPSEGSHAVSIPTAQMVKHRHAAYRVMEFLRARA